MDSIKINAARPYTVGIGRDILSETAKYVKWEHGPCKVMIITDDNVKIHYHDIVMSSFKEEGYEVFSFVIPAGEESKSIATADNIYQALSDNAFGRNDLLVSLGGGVACDLTGFTASTYMRGIDYVQIPTSLLAIIDASIGGKTAVNTKAGKNTVGTFFQPLMVLCDLNCLNTLPKLQYQSGIAEMIKYGILAGEDMFCLFEEDIDSVDELVKMCINVKKSYVETDPYDQHMRKMLNLGHTIGHAVEAASGYDISHGLAVAKGIKAMADIYDTRCAKRIENVFIKNGITDLNIDYRAEEIAKYMTADKKRHGSSITVVVPQNIGVCSFEMLQVNEVVSLLEKVCKTGD